MIRKDYWPRWNAMRLTRNHVVSKQKCLLHTYRKYGFGILKIRIHKLLYDFVSHEGFVWNPQTKQHILGFENFDSGKKRIIVVKIRNFQSFNSLSPPFSEIFRAKYLQNYGDDDSGREFFLLNFNFSNRMKNTINFSTLKQAIYTLEITAKSDKTAITYSKKCVIYLVTFLSRFLSEKFLE